jgi:thioredoxin reductase (NADPH)
MEKLYDAIIIGGGPAGLSSAIYLGRAQYKVLVIEKEKIGGQITITSDVVNYPGVIKTTGTQLTNNMKEQAVSFGAEFLIGDVQMVDFLGEIKTVQSDRGVFSTLSVVVAAGASPRKIGFKGEEEFRGRGVAYCATCDGEFFTGQDIFVIGGGFAAAEEALFLTKYARKVMIIVRNKNFSCAQSIIDEVLEHENIEVFFETELLEVSGEDTLQKAVFQNKATGEVYEHQADMPEGFGVFVFAGYEPASDLYKDKIELDSAGYIVTDMNQKTNVDGIYAAGDICMKSLRQVVTAVSDGAIAATSMEKYISALQKKLNIKREKTAVLQSNKEVDQSHKAESVSGEDSFIDSGMRAQLLPVFDKFEKNIILRAYIDDRDISREVENFLKELSSLSNKIKSEVIHKNNSNNVKDIKYPSIMIFDETDTYLGVQFHGVPGGHEFNSFIVTLYNAAGPGQAIDEALLEQIKSLDKNINIKVIISLSCTMCPEVVMGAARAALENSRVEMEMYDMAHFPEIREKYQIKSVPCIIVNDEEVYFGKKNLKEIAALIS